VLRAVPMFPAMRFAALATTLTAALLAGCSGGPDARTAQELLRQAQAEQLKLRSAGFVVNLNVGVDGERFGATMDGAAETKGQRVGNMFMRMRVTGFPGLAQATQGFAMSMAKRGPRITITADGRTQTFDAGDERAPNVDGIASLGSFDFASCVEQVDVEAGRNLNGEPATRIAGRIDTACVLKAAMKLSGAPAPTAGFDVGALAKHLDDVRVTLFVSERTKLLVGALVSTRFEAEGKHADFQLSYRLTRVNKPVHIPAGL
jgi:hypothetical protein